jgi:putative transposase
MIKLLKNETVFYRGTEYAIFKVKDLINVLIRDKKTNEVQRVPIADLSDTAPEVTNEQDPYDLPIEAYPVEKLKKAQWRLSIIKPFLGELQGDKAAVIRVASANNLNASTLYKWISKFNTYGHVASLIDSELKGGKGKHRLDDKIDKVIGEVIEEIYLPSGKSFDDTFRAISEKCNDLCIKIPHTNTVRRRIKEVSDYKLISKRIGPRTASQKFDPKVGSTPHAKVPLSLVQIDHTELDVMLVDSIERKSFKRPWLTILIDVCTRVVLGFYISFDPPSSYSVGRAIAHAILRKEKFLKSIGLEDVVWPCWGKMTTLYCDNAKEFRGTMLRESCSNYNITLKWRPPRKPEMGGHIERLMGTIADELKDIAGTTKVSKEMRAKFKPEKTAALTLSEFEKWFTVWVNEVYHKRPHRGIDEYTPIEKWEEGIIGNSEHPGIGMPELILNEDKLRLDMLPQYKRTIQRTGVYILKFKYFSGALTRWINAVDENAKGKQKPKRLFVFKMDPHDISSILFFDPKDKRYHTINSTLNIKPFKMSIWDYRNAHRDAKKNSNNKKVTQSAIFAAFKRMMAIEDESKKLTKEAKKKLERESRHAKTEPLNAVPPSVPNESDFKVQNNEIKPYEELEHNAERRSFR